MCTFSIWYFIFFILIEFSVIIFLSVSNSLKIWFNFPSISIWLYEGLNNLLFVFMKNLSNLLILGSDEIIEHDASLPQVINTVAVTIQNNSVYGHFTQFTTVLTDELNNWNYFNTNVFKETYGFVLSSSSIKRMNLTRRYSS